MQTPPYIIAEIGSNCFKYSTPERNLKLAYEQIDAAKACGADATKFQMFTNLELYGVDSHTDYALPREWIPLLKAHCDKRKIDFLCSAFSLSGFHNLNPYVDFHKVASPEACSKEILNSVLCMANPVIVSNGCMTSGEQIAMITSNLWGADDVLLECVSEYPAKFRDYDFGSISNLARKHRILWGVSDHTKTYHTALSALHLGARMFEKHVDLVSVSALKTPDTCVSADMHDFKKYCNKLRSYTAVTDYYNNKMSAKKLYGRQASGYRPRHG